MISKCRVTFMLVSAVVGVPAASAAKVSLSPLPGYNYVETADFDSGHLQGLTTNGSSAIYWSFTNKIVKTDGAGNTLQVVDVIDHHGDATFVSTGPSGGRLYVAVNDRVTSPPGQFNVLNPNNPGRQWIYEYDSDLTYITRHAVPEVIYGAGGIAYHAGKFLIVGGLPTNETRNYVYEYDASFNHLATRTLETGYTDRGIQTAEFAEGHWWFGTYQREGGVRQLFKFNESLNQFSQYSFEASLGIASVADGHFLIGTNRSLANGNIIGRVSLAVTDDTSGLKIVPIPVPEPQSIGLVASGIAGLMMFMSLRQRRTLATAAINVRHKQYNG
jgi:hypothetical protein